MVQYAFWLGILPALTGLIISLVLVELLALCKEPVVVGNRAR